ncbi:TlpA disulfide reductase family protein [Shouchella lonarensis]|uniref:Peroxiredoxin n=1 Tax=Shouchella lonarensis TaxID=1464122 RepID=A0A1G6LG68_9BACI|nr:TlpA disulfide reductase family protein [Shouchella lonarensis]SDC42422.1 Peroxiredoxin [Shouchella lonarensis]
MRWIKIAIVVLIVGVGILFFILNLNTEDHPIGVGDKMPDMKLPIYGEGERGLQDYKGDLVVLNVWASWCEPCVREMPALMEVADHFEDEPVSVVTVNMQAREVQAQDALDFIDEQQLTLPVLLDAEGHFLARVQVSVLPTTYIMDENFVVVEMIRGEVTRDWLIEKIEVHL